MALAAYRHILRSTRIAFQGDIPTLTAARNHARQNFEANRSLSTETEEAKKGIQHAEEVAMILRQNVVQGEAQQGDDSYRLRIHEETERGDNDSVKQGKKGTNLSGVKCCSA